MPKQYKKTSSSSSRGLPFSPPYYPPPPKPAPPPPAAARISGKNPSLNGTGYGGDAREDKRRREQGKKEAKAKERSLLQSQYQILKKAAASMEQQQQQPLSNEILDVLKQVLRNYSSNSITDYKLYDVALKTCDQLCQFHPKQLGSLEQQQQDDDEEDSSSVLIDAPRSGTNIPVDCEESDEG